MTAMLEDSTGVGVTGGEFDSTTPRSTASFAADVKREARRHYMTSPEDCVLMAEDLYSLKLPTSPDVAPWFKAICWCTEGLTGTDGSISAYVRFKARCPYRFTAAQRSSLPWELWHNRTLHTKKRCPPGNSSGSTAPK